MQQIEIKKLANEIVKISMSRGFVVLDEDLEHIADELRSKNIHVINVEKGSKDEDIQKKILPGRIFITNNSKDFLHAAIEYEFGIIATENVKTKDAKILADKISKEISKNSLWSLKSGFLLKLDNKKSKLSLLKD